MASTLSNPRQVQTCSEQWNVQVVRGKVTTRCLWNACKALSIGLFLMAVGAAMAIVGYYADQLSMRSEVRGNSTVRIKNESCGFHLNNLSYAGPIIMGIGGFIVVAACVMTFEARDNAAKVVPARFKPNTSVSTSGPKTTLRGLQRLDSKVNTGSQTPINRGSYKLNNVECEDKSPVIDPTERQMLTSAFVQFSRSLMKNSALNNSRLSTNVSMNRSPSAPNLTLGDKISGHRLIREEATRNLHKNSPKRRAHQEPIRAVDRCTLLSPRLLQRQALSVDNPFYDSFCCRTPPTSRLCPQCSGSQDSIRIELGTSAGVSGSQASMAMDLHDCQVTLKVKDESQSRRSDTSRRHQLLRQRPVEDEKEFCRCSHLMYLNVSEESATLPIAKSNEGQYQVEKFARKDHRTLCFSRSRSCTDEAEQKIYCIEDHKKKRYSSAEKIRCHKSEERWSPNRQGRTNWAVHGEESIGQTLVRKNAKRRRGLQKADGNQSNKEGHRNRSPLLTNSTSSLTKTGNHVA